MGSRGSRQRLTSSAGRTGDEMRDRIDRALAACEEINEVEPKRPPRWVLHLIAKLQSANGTLAWEPADTVEAHAELLDLQVRHQRTPPAEALADALGSLSRTRADLRPGAGAARGRRGSAHRRRGRPRRPLLRRVRGRPRGDRRGWRRLAGHAARSLPPPRAGRAAQDRGSVPAYARLLAAGDRRAAWPRPHDHPSPAGGAHARCRRRSEAVLGLPTPRRQARSWAARHRAGGGRAVTQEVDRHPVRFTGDRVAVGRHTLPEPATVPPADDDADLGGSNRPSGEPGAGRGAPDAVPAVVARHESEGSTRACACGCGCPLDLPRQPNRHGRRGLADMQRT